MTVSDILSSLRVVSIPTVSRFRGLYVREAAVFEGPAGAAEFSPFVEYTDTESAAWLEAAIEFASAPTPPLHRNTIAVNATLPAVDAAKVPELLARYHGYRTVKVKVAEVGQQLSQDVARVRAVRESLGEQGRIRCDANGAWSVEEAVSAIEQLAPFGIEYIEQPCATVSELVELRRHIAGLGVHIAADESVRRGDDPLEVARADAADVLVFKVAPLGGIQRCLDLAQQAGLPVVVSSALETSVGLSMGAFFAAALPRLELASGLATAALLEGDIVEHPLEMTDGELEVRRVELSEARLDQYAASDERTLWWRDRVRRCYELLSDRRS